ncbi:hypothetical protein [Spirosoma validum]|uniref:Uncharacterized protein n=1 Tax=Spirosoma validum TaxID=2771355 RepID=A0A927AY61_9BACT|nr:hypothetical protein [Spirosoma validum]MBD2752014.1 hypothetical protein [Spirosoma validum]
MQHPFYKIVSKTFDSSTSEAILIDWVQAVGAFYQAYQQLNTYRIQPDIHLLQPMPASQCPLGQLEILMDGMQQEIESLLIDMGAAEPSAAGLSRYQKLIDHTARLNRLNQQAQTLGLLMGLSPS